MVSLSLFPGYAVGLWGRERLAIRMPWSTFFVPWRGRTMSTMIGTLYFPYAGDPESCVATAAELEIFIREINSIYPAAELDFDDICFVHAGLFAAEPNGRPTAEPRPQGIITDLGNSFGYDRLCLVGSEIYHALLGG